MPTESAAPTLPTDPAAVAADNLARIDAANRFCLSRLRAWELARAETKDRKAEYDDANDALHALIVKLCGPPPASPEDEPLPLIDAALAGDPGESDAGRKAEIAAGFAAKPDAADAWKTLPVSSLDLLPGVVAKLEESGIATLGQLRAWTAPRPDGLGRRYDQIRGIGPEKALLVADAFGDFLGTWGGGEGEAGEPSTLPFDPGDSGDSPGSSGFDEAGRAGWDAVEVGGADGE